MSEQPDIRRSPRIRTWFETHFSSQRQEGEGVLADISYTGARVEDTGIQPSIGALAILYVCLPDNPKPFQLEGRVARHTEAGFAIEYERPDEDTRCGVDRVAELVGLPEASPSDSSDSTPIEDLDAEPSVDEAEEEFSVDEIEDEFSVETLDEDLSTAELDEDLSTAEVDEDLSATQPRRPKMPQVSELDLAKYEIPELERLAERIESELVDRRDEAKRRVREEIEKLAKREGFSLEEVLDASAESDG